MQRTPRMGIRAQDPLFAPADDARARMRGALVLYLLWCALTWLLEKRVGLFMRYDPPGRSLYALVANVGVGTALASYGLAPAFPWRTRPLVLGVTALAGGAFLLFAVPPAAKDPIVLVNAFAQLLPTSIAEIVVCWLLVGGAVKESTRSTLLAIVAADALFAVYHLAHSAPFDTPAMMAFLAIPGLVVSVILFVLHDRLAAVLAQNLFAMVGITKNLDAGAFRHPFLWAYGVAIASAVVAYVAIRAADRRVT